ncbi:hypothetical protein EP331_11695 [bacterium]|nr:MAG: hypothetical protein EP331_11695 [bacterium]
MELQEIILQMYNGRYKHLTEHEIDFIEAMYKKIIYSRRAPEGSDEASIRRMYKVFIKRSSMGNF